MNVTDVVCSVRDEFGSSISKTLILGIPDCLEISESPVVWPIVLGSLFGLISVCMVFFLIFMLRRRMDKLTLVNKPEKNKVHETYITVEKMERDEQKKTGFWQSLVNQHKTMLEKYHARNKSGKK